MAKEQHGDPDGLQLGSVDGELKLVDFHWADIQTQPEKLSTQEKGEKN